MSYAGADDTGPCEGRQASPSNPTGAGKTRAKEPLTETFVFRCTAAEKAELRAKAEAAGLRNRRRGVHPVRVGWGSWGASSGAAN